MAPNNHLHRQCLLAKRAEIMFQTGQRDALKFKEALELTLPVEELERRLQGSGVISEDELWMYFRYRSCGQEFTEEEYQLFLQVIENCFLEQQIYPEVYYEVAYQFALRLYKMQKYVQCREVCKKTLEELKQGKKTFCLPQTLFLDAVTGMRLRHNAEQERELFQQCKQAYYISLSFCKPEMAQKMLMYCEEEFGWHIIEQVR